MDFKRHVQELWDRERIRQCLSRYCRGADRADLPLLRSAFHDDCLIEHGKFAGYPDAFVAWASDAHADALSTQHCIINHLAEIAGDTAHAETYFTFARMNPSNKPLTLNGGRYVDRFERRGDDWRIAARITLRDWARLDAIPDFSDLSAMTSTAASLSDAERTFMNAARGPARNRSDPSFDRPLVIDRTRRTAFEALVGRQDTRSRKDSQ